VTVDIFQVADGVQQSRFVFEFDADGVFGCPGSTADRIANGIVGSQNVGSESAKRQFLFQFVSEGPAFPSGGANSGHVFKIRLTRSEGSIFELCG